MVATLYPGGSSGLNFSVRGILLIAVDCHSLVVGLTGVRLREESDPPFILLFFLSSSADDDRARRIGCLCGPGAEGSGPGPHDQDARHRLRRLRRAVGVLSPPFGLGGMEWIVNECASVCARGRGVVPPSKAADWLVEGISP